MTAGTGLAGSWAGLDMTERADGGASCGARAALLAVRALLALIWRTRLPYTRSRPDRAHTLRTRSAHASHTTHTRWLAACAPPADVSMAASRATRGHAVTRATLLSHHRQRLNTAPSLESLCMHDASTRRRRWASLSGRAPPLSLYRTLCLHCTRAAVWRRTSPLSRCTREVGWPLLPSAPPCGRCRPRATGHVARPPPRQHQSTRAPEQPSSRARTRAPEQPSSRPPAVRQLAMPSPSPTWRTARLQHATRAKPFHATAPWMWVLGGPATRSSEPNCA